MIMSINKIVYAHDVLLDVDRETCTYHNSNDKDSELWNSLYYYTEK